MLWAAYHIAAPFRMWSAARHRRFGSFALSSPPPSAWGRPKTKAAGKRRTPKCQKAKESGGKAPHSKRKNQSGDASPHSKTGGYFGAVSFGKHATFSCG